MPPRPQTILFGRLNIGYATDEEKNAFIYRSLSANQLIELHSHGYGLFDISNYSREGRSFVCGQLVKYRDTRTEVVDETSHTLREDKVPENVIAKSDFCLDYATGVIAYRVISNRLTSSLFRQAFSELILEANDRLFTYAVVESIQTEITVIQALDQLETITEIWYEVHPTNPSSREPFAQLDAQLRKIRARTYQQFAQNPEGLDKQGIVGDDIRNGLFMAADGYGEGYVKGIKEGILQTIRTGESPLQAIITPWDGQEQFLEKVQPLILEQLQRMRQ